MNFAMSHLVLSFILGALFDFIWLMLWVAYFVAPVRRWIENIFTPGGDLFDKQASYAGMVRFLSNISTLLLGFLLLLPTRVMFDLGFAALIILVYWWIVWRTRQAIIEGMK